MPVQIIKKSNGNLCLKCLTLTHPKAIGEIHKNKIILYLNNGKIHKFQGDQDKYMLLCKTHIEECDIPIRNNIRKSKLDPEIAEDVLFMHNNLDIFDDLLNLNDDLFQNKFDFMKYRDIKLSVIFRFMSKYIHLQCQLNQPIPNFLQFYNLSNIDIKKCISIKYSDYYIHYFAGLDHHYHFMHNDPTITDDQISEIEKCEHKDDCDFRLSYFMIYKSRGKSSRRAITNFVDDGITSSDSSL